MAKSLNLKANWINDETVRISWTDVKANDNNKMAAVVIPLLIFVFFILSAITVLNGGGFGLMGLTIIGSIVGAIWFRSGSTTASNHMDFSAKSITYRGRKYPTSEVSRFEYGMKSQLTGATPMKDGNGNSMSDPMLIRMWLNDAAAVEVSENNWQTQVNHEIRDALSKALSEVQRRQNSAVKAAEFGKSGEFGVPDY